MRAIDLLKRLVSNADSTANSLKRIDQKLNALVAGVANQTELLNRKFDQVIAGLDNQSDLLNRKLNRVIEGIFDQGSAHEGAPGVAGEPQAPPSETASSTLREAMRRIPLLLAERTYNTSHPDYDARVVRNFPGRVFNHDLPCENRAFHALGRLARGNEVADGEWIAVLG